MSWNPFLVAAFTAVVGITSRFRIGVNSDGQHFWEQ